MNTPKPTVLNFNPLLRTMFDMAGIPAKRADAYDAYEADLQADRDEVRYPECCPPDEWDELDPPLNPTEAGLDRAVRDAAASKAI